MDAGRGFFRDALDALGQIREPTLRLFLQGLLQKREENFFFLRARLVQESGIAVFSSEAEMDEHGCIATVVQDHVRHAAVAPFEELAGVIPIIDERLAFDCENRNAGFGDGGGCMILGRINVARDPADIGSECRQRLDQDRRLDCHMQRSGDARAFERLLGTVFCARGHQARHLGLGNGNFLAAPFGQSEIFDDVVVFGGHFGSLQPGLAEFAGQFPTLLKNFKFRGAAACRRHPSPRISFLPIAADRRCRNKI